MTVKHNYLLKAHEIFFQRTVALNHEVKALREKRENWQLNEFITYDTLK